MWIVCQIGAREHYSVARGLHRRGRLVALVTDIWMPTLGAATLFRGAQRMAERYHSDLRSARVCSPTADMLRLELSSRLKRVRGWERIMTRNSLFQRKAVPLLSNPEVLKLADSNEITVFSYSYAARELFSFAKTQGWKTVLGQIDPGPAEDDIVQELRSRYPEWVNTADEAPPPSYWNQWREECALADRIVVNSKWSRSLIVANGINPEKIDVMALAYQNCQSSDEVIHEVSSRLPSIQGENLSQPARSDVEFTRRTPRATLRVLFLGQVIVRKGIQDLVAAAKILLDAPVLIEIVGSYYSLPEGLASNLRFHGPVARSEVPSYFASADVFVLPTHSDGFALTQLEAMAHGLPVIATHSCGDVVVEGQNGWYIPAGEPKVLAERIRWIASNRGILGSMRQSARETALQYGLERMADDLLNDDPS